VAGVGALGALAYQYLGGGGKKKREKEEEEEEEEEEEAAPPPPTSPRKNNPLESPRKGGEGFKSKPLSRVSSKESFSVENPLSISRSGSAVSLSRSSSVEFKRKPSR